MHISEAGSDGEVRADLAQSAVNIVDILWLSVQGVVVNILVVDTIFLTAGDTNFLPRGHVSILSFSFDHTMGLSVPSLAIVSWVQPV